MLFRSQAVEQFENEADRAAVAPRVVFGDVVHVRVDEQRVEGRRLLGAVVIDDRSEERRVGKEC